MDWQRFLFDPNQRWIARLEKLARRRFPDRQLADQAFEQALGKLQENDWAKLQSFQQRSSPGTFLVVVFRHLLEDFAVARFGKCRAPVWVQSLGQIWQLVYKKLCCERQARQSIAEQLASEAHNTQQIEQIARTIQAKIPDCGAQVKFESLSAASSEAVELDIEDEQTLSPEQNLQEQQQQHMLSALQQVFAVSGSWQLGSNGQLSAELASTLRQALDADTALLMKMIFQDDLSIAKAATLLNLPEHTARRKIKACLEQWRKDLTRAGFAE